MLLRCSATVLFAASCFAQAPAAVNDRLVERAIQLLAERSAGLQFSDGPQLVTPSPARRPLVWSRSRPVDMAGTACAIPLLEAPIDPRAIPLLEAPLGHPAPMPVLRPRVCPKR